MSVSHPRIARAGELVVPSTGDSWTLSSVRRLVVRSVRALTWNGVGALIAFFAVYAASISMDSATGGAPHSAGAYLAGFATALIHFLPVVLAVLVAAQFAPQRTLPRSLVLGLAVPVGVAIGQWMVTGVPEALAAWNIEPPGHVASPLSIIVMAWLGLAIFVLKESDRAAERALHDEAERQLDMGRQVLEAQIQVLQSQVEPHFLFNTLAHVRRLYQTDAPAGRAMIRQLSRYLRDALPAVQESGVSLDRDLELAVTYLNLQQVRMGARLEFEIDVPAELGQTRVPPMMITTLVENAIKHGLSALPQGGTVRIAARRDGTALCIQVSDTGGGFQANLGTGVGLANVRARLAMLHGSAAQLSLSRNTPRGVTVTIVVPTLPQLGQITPTGCHVSGCWTLATRR